MICVADDGTGRCTRKAISGSNYCEQHRFVLTDVDRATPRIDLEDYDDGREIGLQDEREDDDHPFGPPKGGGLV